MMSYSSEWVPGAAVLGFVALIWVPGIALIVLAAVALAAVTALVAAVVAGPYLLVRAIARRWHRWHLPGGELMPARTDELVA
jgi:hypothetical protein